MNKQTIVNTNKTNGLDAEPKSSALRNDIAVAAYYRAMTRDFAPGGEIDDWLEAEQEIDQQVWLRAQQALDTEYFNAS